MTDNHTRQARADAAFTKFMLTTAQKVTGSVLTAVVLGLLGYVAVTLRESYLQVGENTMIAQGVADQLPSVRGKSDQNEAEILAIRRDMKIMLCEMKRQHGSPCPPEFDTLGGY